MYRSLIALLFALGLGSAAQAAILPLGNIEATIEGAASTVDGDGTLIEDTFSDDHPLSSPLPLFGTADAETADGTFAGSSAFVEDGFISIDTEVFDFDESTEASALADLTAEFTGTGGIVTLLLDVEHQAGVFGTGAFTATDLLVQVIGPGNSTLFDLVLPLGASDFMQMFNPTFALAAGAIADLIVSLSADSSSFSGSEAFSLTTVSFELDAGEPAVLSETPTAALLLLAAGTLWGLRRRRARR